MLYVELAGLPRSGKSTLLRELRTIPPNLPPLKAFSSEGFEAGLSRFPLQIASLKLSPGKGAGAGNPERSRALIRDAWMGAAVLEYPELFAQVLLSTSTIGRENRQREIVLNYWRSRLSLHRKIVLDPAAGWGLVDEGLTQTALSTISRIQKSVGKTSALRKVNSLTKFLPTDRLIVFLEVPMSTMANRHRKNSGLSLGELYFRQRALNRLREMQALRNNSVLTLDGAEDPSALAGQLVDFLNYNNSIR